MKHRSNEKNSNFYCWIISSNFNIFSVKYIPVLVLVSIFLRTSLVWIWLITKNNFKPALKKHTFSLYLFPSSPSFAPTMIFICPVEDLLAER